jgi:GTP 3',8-cyclase
MRDAFGREINYLRISVTDRCNLRCRYCMPEAGIDLLPRSEILSYEQITEIARVAVRMGIRKIRLTGGEPLVRKGVPELVRALRPIRGLGIIGMTTNGTMLAPLAAELATAGLDSVNISLDTLDPARYRFITRGGEIERALEGIRAAISARMAVKLNMVVSEEITKEEISALRDFAFSLGISVQTISRYSLQDKKKDGYVTDRPPSCSGCNRIRLLPNGVVRSCLHSDIDFKIDFNDIERSIAAAILAKPMRGLVSSTVSVGQIGG